MGPPWVLFGGGPMGSQGPPLGFPGGQWVPKGQPQVLQGANGSPKAMGPLGPPWVPHGTLAASLAPRAPIFKTNQKDPTYTKYTNTYKAIQTCKKTCKIKIKRYKSYVLFKYFLNNILCVLFASLWEVRARKGLIAAGGNLKIHI